MHLLRELVYIMFIRNNQATTHLWWKEIFEKHQKVSNLFFTFIMSLLTTLIFKNSHILVGTYFMFLKNFLDQTWNDFNTKFGPQKKDWEIRYCELVALNVGENYVKQSNLKRSEACLAQRNVLRDKHPPNVCDKLQFSCEIAHYRKSSISVFQEIFASADKVLFRKEDWAWGNNSMKF